MHKVSGPGSPLACISSSIFDDNDEDMEKDKDGVRNTMMMIIKIIYLLFFHFIHLLSCSFFLGVRPDSSKMLKRAPSQSLFVYEF